MQLQKLARWRIPNNQGIKWWNPQKAGGGWGGKEKGARKRKNFKYIYILEHCNDAKEGPGYPFVHNLLMHTSKESLDIVGNWYFLSPLSMHKIWSLAWETEAKMDSSFEFRCSSCYSQLNKLLESSHIIASGCCSYSYFRPPRRPPPSSHSKIHVGVIGIFSH